jgi:uncharacterized protein (DUF433 family)
MPLCYNQIFLKEYPMAGRTPEINERIMQDPDVLVGKPVVAGTRIPVALVLGHLAQNPDLQDLFSAYPELTVQDVKACLAYAQAAVEAEGKRATRRVPHSNPL